MKKALLRLGLRFLLACSVLSLLGAAPRVRAEEQKTEPTPTPLEGQTSTTAQATTDRLGGGRSGPNYVIGPEDVLDIDVFNVPELSKTVRVGNDGTISLALLGRVPAAGLTAQQLREELEAKYGETYVENPNVSVFIKEFHAQPVSLIGAVERPGIYQLTGSRTLIEMLSMAGGLAKRSLDSAGRTVIVTRKEGFQDVQLADGMRLLAPDKLEINIRKLLYSHEDALNIPVKPFDTISVTKADIVYVVGDVKKPGGFVLQDQEKLTVLQALALAEGLNGTAAKGSARIIRSSEDGSRTEIPVNLNKILKGKSPDTELATNDILFVPDSAAKVAGKRGVEAAISTVTGVIIWRRP